MNLRSGETVDKIAQSKVKTIRNKQLTPRASPIPQMADMGEIKSLMVEMKDSISKEIKDFSKEIKDFRTEFKEFRAETEKDIKTIMQQTTELRLDLQKTSGRLEQVECRVGELHDTEILHHKSIKYLVNKVSDMEERTEYLENKSRQNNVRIFNIAEKSEGKSMTTFLKQLFNEVLKIPGEFNILRAHRLFREEEDKTRPIIVAFLSFETKMDILRAAWGVKDLSYNGTRIYFNHDFTSKVNQQRALYKHIRVQLKAKNIKSHILAPAKLKVFREDGTSQTYGNPEAATKALEELGLVPKAQVPRGSTHLDAQSMERNTNQRHFGDMGKRSGENIMELVQEAGGNLGI